MTNKRVIDIPIVGGLNQKEADKNLVPPNLLTLENGTYNKNGRIDKRFGFTNLGQTVSSGNLTTPRALENLEDELLMISQDRIYSYAESESTWQDRGEIGIVTTELDPTNIQSDITMQNVDSITQDDIQVIAWREGNRDYYSIYDKSTLAFITRRDTIPAVSDVRFRLTATPGNIYIVFNENNDIKALRIPTSSPTSTSVTTIVSDAESDGTFDAIGFTDTFIYLAYKEAGLANLKLVKLTSALASSATRTIASQSPNSSRSISIAVFNSPSQGQDIVCLGWNDAGANLKGAILDTSLADIVATKVLQVNPRVGRITILPDSSDVSTVGYYFANEAASGVKDYATWYTSLTVATGSNTTVIVLLGSVSPVSRGFVRNSVGYFLVMHESALQPTYFLINTQGKVLGKFAAGQGPAYSDLDKPTNITASSTTDYLVGILKKNRIRTVDQELFANLGTFFGSISFDSSKTPITTKVNNTLLISGSILRSYDGVSATEYGFHLFPEDVTATPVAGAGIPDGTYLVQAMYEWTDAKGNVFKSAPSVAQSVTTGGGNNQIQVVIPILRITDKSNDLTLTDRQEVTIKTFITEASGTIPYLADSTRPPDITTNQNVTRLLTTDPATLTANEFLYTSGGTIENIAPDSSNFSFVHDNRITNVGLENKNQIQISKEIRPSTNPGFNEDLTLTIDPVGGGIICGASMDNNLIIFKKTATYVISGSGANDLGAGSTYGPPQLISSDIGCSEPKSVLQLPDGIIFRSTKGIYILDRSLALSYIGAPVEDEINNAQVVSTDIITSRNEIRFALSTGKFLTYNYFFGRWSTATAPGILDSTIWKNETYSYITNSKVLTESPTLYTDDGEFVTTTLRTGWIHLAGLKGYQRIQRIGVLGTYYTNNAMTISIYKDYKETPSETKTIMANDIVNANVYGDSMTYGSDSVYGGEDFDEVYQVRYHVQNQKSEAISIELTDSLVGTNAGQSYSLNGFSLTVQGKSGIFKARTSRSR